ncbi:chemosensory receptor C [Elysia marginata]|uniref:Chemosensory receptor C n=1 Tax=Elysia marginata TaxID=1093978 RepID=A0AAV4HN39_9GAST|nr:chemosensory receptor C [Elysia marginata]
MSSLMNSTQLISDELFNTINKTVMIPVNIFITILGILNNTVNIVIFTKLATTDTMTMSLTALAVSDVLFCCFTLPNFIISALISSGIQILYNVDLTSLLYVGFVWQRPLFHKISIAITMFVSCERSLCVVKPFLVKRIFTRRRVIAVLVGIFCILTALFMPVYVSGGLVKQKTPNGSDYLFVMNLSPERATAEHIVHLLSGFSLVLTTHIAIVISSVFMAVGLRRHQRFRQKVSIARPGNKPKQKEHDPQHIKTGTPNTAQGPCTVAKTTDSRSNAGFQQQTGEVNMKPGLPKTMSQDSSSKEHRLMKTVFTLAVIHVILNSPVLIHYVFYYLQPDFRVRRRFGNLYLLSVDIAASLHCLNGMVNIFVYLVLNTKFRLMFKDMFCCGSSKSN